MNNSRTNKQRGMSVVELVIVLVVLGVVTTLAVMAFGGARVDLQRQGIARELKIYLERARFDSVKRRAELAAEQARITFTSPSSFTARVDFNEDGVLSAAETRIVDFSQRSQTQIIISDTGRPYPITISFDQRGHATVVDNTGTAVSPIFTICSAGNCSTPGPDRTVISVSSSGTVSVMKNGQTPTAPPTPTIGNSSPTLNCYVLITNANTTCSL